MVVRVGGELYGPPLPSSMRPGNRWEDLDSYARSPATWGYSPTSFKEEMGYWPRWNLKGRVPTDDAFHVGLFYDKVARGELERELEGKVTGGGTSFFNGFAPGAFAGAAAKARRWSKSIFGGILGGEKDRVDSAQKEKEVADAQKRKQQESEREKKKQDDRGSSSALPPFDFNIAMWAILAAGLFTIMKKAG